MQNLTKPVLTYNTLFLKERTCLLHKKERGLPTLLRKDIQCSLVL